MTREQIQQEIEVLNGDIARLQHDLILATGAKQAFTFILNEMDKQGGDVVTFPAPAETPADEPAEEKGYGSGV